jgi:DNA-binding transcriptional LysR family regulator
MESLRGMVNFVETARCGSFAGAAQVLGISSVAVSKNVSRLEAQLQQQLFARSTRKLTLTAQGLALLAQCEGPLAELANAFSGSRAASDAMQGTVRITAVSPFVRGYLAPQLLEFHREHPLIALDIVCSEQVNDLVAERFDVGIRIGALQDEAYVARPLGPLHLVLCAAPGFFARVGLHSHSTTPADLASSHGLALKPAGESRAAPWRLSPADSAGKPHPHITLDVQGPLQCNDFMALTAACASGLGVAQIPLVMALPLLRSGALQLLWPELCPQGLHLFLHYPNRQLPARVRAVVDFVLKVNRTHPDLQETPQHYAAAQSRTASPPTRSITHSITNTQTKQPRATAAKPRPRSSGR